MQFQGFIIRNILKSKHWYEGYKISQYFKKWINSKENFKMSSRTRKKSFHITTSCMLQVLAKVDVYP